MDRRPLTRFALLSLIAAIVTIALKLAAWYITASVGMLSDALESVVNVVAAGATMWLLFLSAKPPDHRYAYGYSKAEYFASAFEGALILVAAGLIAWAAIERLVKPQALEKVGLGAVVSLVATAINLIVARLLLQGARRHNSIALEADAHHLMTDVWTSVGVVIAVVAVSATGWSWLDPVIALVVAGNIVFTGVALLRRSAFGLMDEALPPERVAKIEDVLGRYRGQGVDFHAIRTRAAAGRSFVSMHVLVPGAWTVKEGHDLVERIEHEVATTAPGTTVFTHLEPREDPASYRDESLDRHTP
ncbi:MAG TPA: cation diffusion facilitator family transporter [Casimicrobiaceae bacterium]|nr:cation diffusion facilitator family transporter [Casimicrobiaceae bacterium]